MQHPKPLSIWLFPQQAWLGAFGCQEPSQSKILRQIALHRSIQVRLALRMLRLDHLSLLSGVRFSNNSGEMSAANWSGMRCLLSNVPSFIMLAKYSDSAGVIHWEGSC